MIRYIICTLHIVCNSEDSKGIIYSSYYTLTQRFELQTRIATVLFSNFGFDRSLISYLWTYILVWWEWWANENYIEKACFNNCSMYDECCFWHQKCHPLAWNKNQKTMILYVDRLESGPSSHMGNSLMQGKQLSHCILSNFPNCSHKAQNPYLLKGFYLRKTIKLSTTLIFGQG